jgi:hypothetical protein
VPKDTKGPPKDVWQDSAVFTLRLAPNGKGESDIYLTNNFQDMRDINVDVGVQRPGGGYGTKIPWKDWRKGQEQMMHTTMPRDALEFNMKGRAQGTEGPIDICWRWLAPR